MQKMTIVPLLSLARATTLMSVLHTVLLCRVTSSQGKVHKQYGTHRYVQFGQCQLTSIFYIERYIGN